METLHLRPVLESGIEMVIFRGTERNKRRGFHNLSVLASKMDRLPTRDPEGILIVADRYTIRVPAIRVRQGGHFIYCFGIDGKRIHDFATVSRVHRDDHGLNGYQRPEVLSHIKAIRRYLRVRQRHAPQRGSARL